MRDAVGCGSGAAARGPISSTGWPSKVISPGHRRSAGEQTGDRPRGHRLAGARLADEPHRLAGADLKRHLVDDRVQTTADHELHVQVRDVEQRRRGAHEQPPRPSLRGSDAASKRAVADDGRSRARGRPSSLRIGITAGSLAGPRERVASGLEVLLDVYLAAADVEDRRDESRAAPRPCTRRRPTRRRSRSWAWICAWAWPPIVPATQDGRSPAVGHERHQRVQRPLARAERVRAGRIGREARAPVVTDDPGLGSSTPDAERVEDALDQRHREAGRRPRRRATVSPRAAGVASLRRAAPARPPDRPGSPMSLICDQGDSTGHGHRRRVGEVARRGRRSTRGRRAASTGACAAERIVETACARLPP